MQGNSTIGWQMDTTCALGVNLIYCPQNNIRDLTGIQYFGNLQTLHCGYNQLSSLPALPNSLQVLGCDSNQLSSLPALPNSLTTIYCSMNQLSSLPALPNSLTYLGCDNNQLSSLPVLPDSLKYLDCNNNQLSSLPALPNILVRLGCQNNQLSNLPVLPDSLTDFVCDNNQLSSLPALPNSLTTIHCSGNQLNSLPLLPNSLTELYCSFNQLSSLSELPDSLTYFFCSDNPHLYCLPQLKKITSFFFYNTSITCLPNYPQSNNYSIPTLDTVPLCDSNNINGCSYCHANFSLYPDTANPGIYNGYNLSYGSNLTSYLWEFGDGATSTLQYPSHTYAQAGQYYVCLTAGGVDCTNTYCDSSYLVFKTENGLMSQLNILNPTTTAIQSTNSLKGEPLRINPNPASSLVNVSIDENMIESNLTVYDITGRKMAAVQLKTANAKLETSSFTSGVYFVTVENEKGRVTKKLVIQNP